MTDAAATNPSGAVNANANADRYVEACRAGKPIDWHPVIDAHAHLGQNHNFLILDSSAEGMIRAKDRIGIDRTAVSSIPGTIGGWSKGNDVVIDAVQRFPDRFIGYITVNGFDPGSVLAECERCWAGGCRALKLHTAQGFHYDRPELAPAFEFANDKRCPILLHVWGWELDHIEPLLGRYPHADFILAHAGSDMKERYAEVGNAYPNAWLETCFSKCPKGMIEYFISEGLEDCTLWGSDADFYAASHQVGRVLMGEMTPAVKKKLLYDNAAKLFGVDR